MHQKPAINRTAVRRGFTVLELLIVMSIAGAVAVIAIPSVDVAGMRVNSSVRQVGMTMLNAQRLAVLKQHNVIVVFDTANRMVVTHLDRNNDGVLTDGETTHAVQLEDGVVFGLGSAPAAGFGTEAITFVKRQGDYPIVTFSRSGSAGEYGGFYMTSKRGTASARYATDTRGFEVNRGTGRTTMYHYTGDQWQRSF